MIVKYKRYRLYLGNVWAACSLDVVEGVYVFCEVETEVAPSSEVVVD